MKKFIISSLTIATLMGSFATSANAGWTVTTNAWGTSTISGNGSHSGMRYTCSTNAWGTTSCY
ncbi:MAG: hypothetical protein ACJ0BV_08305 [Paracoccaceae bacterium]